MINYKSELIKNNDFDEFIFKSKYTGYLTNFNKSKSFNENICDESIDDELFKEYAKIIIG